ncbi:hypothetical protein PV08_03200 [Exophiala spinifera]|uniref:Uncharacterized protein n=1 Tax=Exophiala spinifera TaxID=91928 RepID=A0A0D1YUH8_9EURO|nr:uncharacterized protein PV08_03200 [Exophiala spinifera]KIW18911.1 hypothetical protein PV08_03200 [Exophiala spinifera]
MQNPKPQVTVSFSVPNHPLRSLPTNIHNGARFPKRTIAASPLSKEIPQLSPESQRPSLRARNSVTSRASSVPSTPLDDIPRPLWERTFIRTATTPEATSPELSIEEITSTKLSLDDEEFLTSLPDSENYKQAKLGISCARKCTVDIGEDRPGRWKKMRRTLRKIPNDLFAWKSRPSTPVKRELCVDHPATTESLLPEPELLTESCVPPPAKSTDVQEPDKEIVEPLVLDYDGMPKGSVSRSEELSQVSRRIREELKDSSRMQTSSKSTDPPPHFRGPFLNQRTHKLSSKARVAATHLYGQRGLPPDFPPRRRRLTDKPTTSARGEGAHRYSVSIHRPRRPSLSNATIGQNSAASIGRTSRPSSRPGTNAESNKSISGRTAVPRPMVYMDGAISSSTILWDHGFVRQRPSTSSTTRPAPNSASRPTTRAGAEPCAVRSPAPEIEMGGRDIPEWAKVPTFVPRTVRAPRRTANQVGLSGDTAPLKPAREESDMDGFQPELNLSDTAISDVSFASLHVQTSNQSSLERQAVLRNKENEFEVPQRTSAKSRERISQLLATTWKEGNNKIRRMALQGPAV